MNPCSCLKTLVVVGALLAVSQAITCKTGIEGRWIGDVDCETVEKVEASKSYTSCHS